MIDSSLDWGQGLLQLAPDAVGTLPPFAWWPGEAADAVTSAVAAPAPAVLARGAVGLEVNEVNDVVFVCDSNPNVAGATLTGLNLADATVAVTHQFPGANDFCNDVTFDGTAKMAAIRTALRA